VTLQLNWSHEVEFSGYYVAHEKGFFAEENLDVVIYEGGFPVGVNEFEVFINRETDFSILEFEYYRGTLTPEIEGIAVIAIFQTPPPVLFSLSDSGIQKPQDMIGKRVAIKDTGWREIIHTMLHNAGVDPTKIIEVEVPYDAIELLYNGDVDIWTGFAHDEPTEARLAGYDLNLMFVGNYSVGAYEGLLTVHQQTLVQNPDLVSRFVKASLRGWQYAIEHPDETAEIVHKWQPGNSLEFHQLAMQAIIPLIDTGYAPIGWIDAERWQTALGDAYNPERPGYTMQFIETTKD
jgi:ABC-type nitrate/sulfonate/bicarbonate transport system substrate-binding protein